MVADATGVGGRRAHVKARFGTELARTPLKQLVLKVNETLSNLRPDSGRRQLRVERSAAQVMQIEDGMGFPFRNHNAVVEDIGIGGIGLKMRCTAIAGDRIRLVLTDPGSRKAMRFNAVVRWRGGEHFGLKWVGLSAEQQAWLRTLLLYWAGERAMGTNQASSRL